MITITIHHLIHDEREYEDEELYQVSDDGNHYDDSEELSLGEAEGDADERVEYYAKLGSHARIVRT